jgi:hypothetical protein
MRDLIASIEQSLKTENWYGALAVALTVPDVCSSLESTDKKSKVGPRYAKWFDTYVGPRYAFSDEYLELLRRGGVDLKALGPAWLTGKDCYALRCSVLHNSSGDTAAQPAHEILERFMFRPTMGHSSRHSKGKGPEGRPLPETLTVGVRPFCEDIVAGACAWLESVGNNASVQGRIAAMLVIHPDHPRGSIPAGMP